MSTEQGAPQLQMIWPQSRLQQPPEYRMPEGYILRQYRQDDLEDYIRLMAAAGFTGWTEDNVSRILRRVLPNGFFVVERGVGGRLAATATAQRKPTDYHSFGAELGWVAGDPAHKGRGLGCAVCAAAVARALDAGYSRIYLLTDDHRLPAIAVYIRLGFVPFIIDDDMRGRWRAVLSQLGVDFDNVSSEFASSD